jgi:hypothetical protein
MVLLFADVKGVEQSEHAGEDEDNYRFLHEAAAGIGAELVVVNEGRDIWTVYHDEHMLGNSRVAPCSKRLKQIPARKWVEDNCDPSATTLYVGLDWTEIHRLEPQRRGWDPYRVEAPMTDKPYMVRAEVIAWMRREGIEPPRLYDLGFQHANCGGFCCRMGHAQAAHLLRVFPDRYAYHEAKEAQFREEFGRDVAFLRDRRGGDVDPLTLTELRERIEASAQYVDEFDWGGCGCFMDEGA